MQSFKLTALVSVLFITVLSHGVSARTNYVDCLSQLKVEYNSTGLVGGLDSDGQAVPISEASSITYALCKSSCETYQEAFSPSDFLQEFSAWLLPYLALASQLPFGAKYRQDNLTSVLLTIGSPMLTSYSLIITLLNSRWITRRFETIDYPNRDLAVRVLISLQQVPLRVTSEDSLLASLIVLPENDEWWSELTQLLDFLHTWSISSVVSVTWVAVAYVFAMVDSIGYFTSNFRADTGGQSVSSVWLWLLAIVVGWRQLSPKSDHNRVSKALSRANSIAFVAGSDGAVKASSRSRQRAISIDVLYHGSLYFADENRSPPVFNYARAISWSHSAEEVFEAFHSASNNARSHRPVNSIIKWQDEGKGNEIHPANRMGSPSAIRAYCLAPRDTPRSRWASGIFVRMCIASLISLILQWGTITATLLGIIYTPTTGLGCRSLAYLLYGAVSTLIWLIFVASSVLAHYASHRPKTTSSRITIRLSEGLCWIGKVTATLNGIWIITICMLQFSNVLDTCFCDSNILTRGASAYMVIIFSNNQLDIMRRALLGGLFVGLGCAIGFVVLVNLTTDSLS